MVDDTVGWATLVAKPCYQHLLGHIPNRLGEQQRYAWALAVARSFQARPPNRHQRR